MEVQSPDVLEMEAAPDGHDLCDFALFEDTRSEFLFDIGFA